MPSYHRPTTLADGLSLLTENTLIVAGATDVYPAQTQRQAWGEAPSRQWLDISAVSELQGIQSQPDHWRIGSLATWTDLIRHELPQCFNGLKAAAREVGGIQIQNRGTLVGNLCNASPAADGVPPLLSLNASVEIASAAQFQVNERRVVPLDDFLTGNRQTTLAPDEIVTAILIPHLTDNARGSFCKLGARKYLVISIVMAAIVIDVDSHSTIIEARVAVGSCSAVAMRLGSLESRLIGRNTSESLGSCVKPDDFDALTPIDDIRADAAYRQSAAVEIVSRLLNNITPTGAAL